MFQGLDASQAHPVRRWTALVSFTLQAMLIAAALVLPLFRPASLPDASSFRRIFLPAPEGSPQPHVNTNVNNTAVSSAPELPIQVRSDLVARTPITGTNTTNEVGPPNIGPIGNQDSAIRSIISDEHFQPVQRPQAVISHAAPVSVIMEGNLLRKVEPRYPEIAVRMGIQGTVVIKALISRDGTVERPQVMSGQAFLAAAAMDAVKEWRYRPYYLNGQPVEVETQITVNFVLNR